MNIHAVMPHTVLNEALARAHFNLGPLSENFTPSDALKAVNHIQAQQALAIPEGLYRIIGFSRLSCIDGRIELSQTLLNPNQVDDDAQLCRILNDMFKHVLVPNSKWIGLNVAREQRLIKYALLRTGCAAAEYWKSFSAHRHQQHVDLATLMKMNAAAHSMDQASLLDYHTLAHMLSRRWYPEAGDQLKLKAYHETGMQAWQTEAAANLHTLMLLTLKLFRSQAKLDEQAYQQLQQQVLTHAASGGYE